MILLSSFVVCMCGIFFVAECSKVNAFAIRIDSGRPTFFITLHNTLVFGSPSSSASPIPHVLGGRNNSKVFSTVIKSVTVNMVDKYLGVINAHYDAVHSKGPGILTIDEGLWPSGIGSMRLNKGLPIVVADKVEIFRIYDSEKATGKRNVNSSYYLAHVISFSEHKLRNMAVIRKGLQPLFLTENRGL